MRKILMHYSLPLPHIAHQDNRKQEQCTEALRPQSTYQKDAEIVHTASSLPREWHDLDSADQGNIAFLNLDTDLQIPEVETQAHNPETLTKGATNAAYESDACPTDPILQQSWQIVTWSKRYPLHDID